MPERGAAGGKVCGDTVLLGNASCFPSNCASLDSLPQVRRAPVFHIVVHTLCSQTPTALLILGVECHFSHVHQPFMLPLR